MIASFATKFYMEGVAIIIVKLTLKQNYNPNTVILQSETNKMGLEKFEEMLNEIVPIALHCGVQFGSIQIVESVHSIAKVNTPQGKKREEEGNSPHDPAAYFSLNYLCNHKWILWKAAANTRAIALILPIP